MGIFGGSKSQSTSQQTSGNQAYPFIQSTYGDTAGSTGSYSSLIQSLLGVGGTAGAGAAGLNAFQNSAGYQNALTTGSNAITGNNAAKGLLNSGATLKALDRFGSNLGNSYYNDYLNSLFNGANLGIGAGQLISGSGQTSQGTSTSSSSSSPGISGLVGAGISGFASGGGLSNLFKIGAK